MSDAARKLMTADEFIAWNLDPGMMAGASERHDQIVVNLIQALRRLRGGPCRVKTVDQAAKMERRNVRYPDVTVDCAAPAPGSLESVAPTVFFEVLSPSTRRFDLLRKADEYRRTATLKHFVLLEPDAVKALLWSRGPDGESVLEEAAGPDAELALPGVGVSLPIAEVYEDVELSAAE